MRSSSATGVDVDDAPIIRPPPPPPPSRPSANSHSCLPSSGLYERTRPGPQTTISVRFLFFQTDGVLHDDRSSRLTRHSSSPVFLLRAMRNDFSSLSHCTNRRSPSSVGELPVP